MSFAEARFPHDIVAKMWDQQKNFSDTNVSLLPYKSKFEDQIPLTLVVLKDSGWTHQMVIDKLTRTMDIYSQCKIGFYPITLIETKNISGTKVNRDKPYSFLADEDLNGRAFDKPIVYFVDQEVRNRNYGGYSWRASSPGGQSSRQKRGSAFLYRSWATTPDRSTDLENTKPSQYEVMAHELAHILLDESHHGEDHIMAGMKTRTNKIYPWQCERIRDVRGL